jgi:hypothetical protein
MALAAYRGVFKNGQIEFESNAELQEGDEVIVTVLKQHEADSEVKGITPREILESGMVGMWADRDDIEDSAKFAEDIRRRAERRHRDDD